MIHDTRIHTENDKPPRDDADYVLYWMQGSQRTRCNHALEHAATRANERGLPLLVCFGLTDGSYPEANARHYEFMLEGLRDAAANLKKRGVAFVCKIGNPAEVALHYAKNAALVVSDTSYTRPPRAWYEQLAKSIDCRYERVEANVVVPVGVASDKEERAAYTIRRKLQSRWGEYLVPLETVTLKRKADKLDVTGDVDVSDPAAARKKLKVDESVPPSPLFDGGENAAAGLLERFVDDKLAGYAAQRNEPSNDKHSYMSMSLHFGQIAPLELALAVRGTKKGDADDRDSYIEELLIRRELAKNFVYYQPRHDSFDCVPEWAQKTLADHADDKRPYVYSREELESSQTHDDYWNAAMTQMRLTGFMHNYMRMYWGKKILEWGRTPRESYDTLLSINNKYFIDGRDPNSYSNVAWVFGLHDRPWQERKVFGKVRYMNAAGLERKFDIDKYVRQIQKLEAEHGGGR